MKTLKYSIILLASLLLIACGGGGDSSGGNGGNNGGGDGNGGNGGGSQENPMQINTTYKINGNKIITAKENQTKLKIVITHSKPRKTTVTLQNGKANID